MNLNKKNILSIIILIGTVLLGGFAIFTAIRLYQLRNQSVAPNVPSSKPAAQTVATYPRTQTVVLPKFNKDECPWRQGDNLAKRDGYSRARISKTVDFSLMPNCTLTGGNVNTLNRPGNYLYDDTLFITIDNKVLAGTNTVVTPLGGIGSAFDWEKIKDTRQYSQRQETKIICIGSTCEAPYTFKHTNGDKQPLVNISLSEQNLATLLNTANSTHTFGATVVGDTDSDTDCKLQQDLILTLNYSCQADVIACEEVVFTINTPTPTASPTAPPVACNLACTTGNDSQCAGTLECINNICRNPNCDTETDCVCNESTPTPTATPTTSPTASPTSTPTATPTITPTPTPVISCNDTCSQPSDCSNGTTCTGGRCRNASCSSETDCICPSSATATPTPTSGITTTRTSAPELPEAGISTPTLIGGIAGILLLIGAVLLAI